MNEKNIVEITSEGLMYLNEDGETQFINFADCYQRYLDRLNDPDHVRWFKTINHIFSDEELDASLEGIRAKKEVGWRDFSVPYILF
jgi:ribosomal protein L24E